MRRQALNVFRMQLLGAEVREVNAGSRTLKDAINEALRDWVTNVGDTYYLLGSALGRAIGDQQRQRERPEPPSLARQTPTARSNERVSQTPNVSAPTSKTMTPPSTHATKK